MLLPNARRFLVNVLQKGRAYSTNLRCTSSVNRVPPIVTFDLSSLKQSLDIAVPPFPRTCPIGIPPATVVELPVIRRDESLKEPTSVVGVKDPTTVVRQEAARMIVIRRRKMRRHKLKKLRKKMHFTWAKVRQKREMKKEKEFQAEIMCKINEAENFNATAYVQEKIDKANEVLIPKLWKGKRLPEFVIKDLLEEKKKKQEFKLQRIEKRKKLSMNVADYKV
ncbi:uncharacterized protein LOC106670407 [Cimex lectularius]|uniref:Ribosomal protein mS38 C-terminal domain-containing protein n=1 Tax=Cimex lectularius TaxID=79782 RepID=A0A8I6S302_CIMLE|nr:uncharacterized protein LOC106670407 [Cimex lectularius]